MFLMGHGWLGFSRCPVLLAIPMLRDVLACIDFMRLSLLMPDCRLPQQTMCGSCCARMPCGSHYFGLALVAPLRMPCACGLLALRVALLVWRRDLVRLIVMPYGPLMPL